MVGSSASSSVSAAEKTGFCHGIRQVLREQRHCGKGGTEGSRVGVEKWMDPTSPFCRFFSLNVSSPQSKGEFSSNLLLTQGVECPIHLI